MEEKQRSKPSEIRLSKPGKVRVTARVSAFLDEKPNRKLQNRPLDQKPYWDVERARIGDSRRIPLELVVNGFPVAKKNIVANGTVQDLAFDVSIERSSWVALRIFPSSHTNPVFVLVDGKPIRASRRSVEWCLKAVDQCWSQKRKKISAEETAEAEKAYQHARETYRRILADTKTE